MKVLPVIMSGGAGTRLWPLSRTLYPKQFLAMSGRETLFQQAASHLSELGAWVAVWRSQDKDAQESAIRGDVIIDSSVNTLIVASSANIYGNSLSSPIAESASPQPMNHYALSKLAMEALVQKWFSRISIVVVRPFNYTGPGQSESFVFSKIVGAFARSEPELRLGNIDVSRDLSDVRLVVEAYARLLLCDARSEFFNICSGRSISLENVIDEKALIAGYMPKVSVDPAFVRQDEVKSLYGDPSRLFSAVGDISIPGLRETLLSMYEHKVTVKA